MHKELWEKCIRFHGHACGGLTIGYQAARYALQLLQLPPSDGKHDRCLSEDEQIVCISENDACGVDAIQVLLGCSVGKGNLLFHLRGKQAFSFYNRHTDTSFRLVLKTRPEGLTRAQSFDYYQSLSPEEMFDVKDAVLSLPAPAKIFISHPCACCGESTAEPWIRLQEDRKLCVDCHISYSRFDV